MNLNLEYILLCSSFEHDLILVVWVLQMAWDEGDFFLLRQNFSFVRDIATQIYLNHWVTFQVSANTEYYMQLCMLSCIQVLVALYIHDKVGHMN